MRRGFFRLWVAFSVLWVGVWLVIGFNDRLIVSPTDEAAPVTDQASNAPSPDAEARQVKREFLHPPPRTHLQSVRGKFNPAGTLAVIGLASSAPALLLAIGWAFAGFSGAVRRN